MAKRALLIATFLLLCFAFAASARAVQEPQLTEDQMRQFLLNAKVIQSRPAKKGVTNTLRLTLSDGNITHDASFQSINEHRAKFESPDGAQEINFVDSYKYNIAAYALAELVGITWLTPQMDRLFVDGPSGRRRFLDRQKMGHLRQSEIRHPLCHM